MPLYKCKGCQDVMEFPEPPPKEIIKREPCRCGITETARIVRALAFVLVVAFLGITGSCISNHYWTTQQIQLLKQDYEVKETGTDGFFNDPDYKVEKKVPAEKK